MELQELQKQMKKLNKNIRTLMTQCGYAQEGLEAVTFDKEDPESLLLYKELHKAMVGLEDVCISLNYLEAPVDVEGPLVKLPNGCYRLQDRELSCGTRIEVLFEEDEYDPVRQQDVKKPRWVASTIESFQGRCFLAARPGINLDGLQAKVRRVRQS